MNFKLTGNIVKIDPQIKTFCKCVLKDNFTSVIVLIPAELLKDVSLNDELEMWGQIKGYDYNGKIYNNLFANSIIKLTNKIIILEYINSSSFRIELYSPVPLTKENSKIITKNRELIQKSEILRESITSEKAEIDGTFCNAYAIHIDKAIKSKLIRMVNETIHFEEPTQFFVKLISEAPFIFFTKQSTIEIDEEFDLTAL